MLPIPRKNDVRYQLSYERLAEEASDLMCGADPVCLLPAALNKESFARWLLAQPQERMIGDPKMPMECPLHTYLAEVFGAERAQMSVDNWYHCARDMPVPTWAFKLQLEMMRHTNVEISAGEALGLLMLCV